MILIFMYFINMYVFLEKINQTYASFPHGSMAPKNIIKTYSYSIGLSIITHGYYRDSDLVSSTPFQPNLAKAVESGNGSNCKSN